MRVDLVVVVVDDDVVESVSTLCDDSLLDLAVLASVWPPAFSSSSSIFSGTFFLRQIFWTTGFESSAIDEVDDVDLRRFVGTGELL